MWFHTNFILPIFLIVTSKRWIQFWYYFCTLFKAKHYILGDLGTLFRAQEYDRTTFTSAACIVEWPAFYSQALQCDLYSILFYSILFYSILFYSIHGSGAREVLGRSSVNHVLFLILTWVVTINRHSRGLMVRALDCKSTGFEVHRFEPHTRDSNSAVEPNIIQLYHISCTN